MGGAVQLNDELARLADEVREVAIDRDLSQEPEPAGPAVADELPQGFLGQGLVLAKAAGVGDSIHGDSVHGDSLGAS
jgi:hypothetical protein